MGDLQSRRRVGLQRPRCNIQESGVAAAPTRVLTNRAVHPRTPTVFRVASVPMR